MAKNLMKIPQTTLAFLLLGLTACQTTAPVQSQGAKRTPVPVAEIAYATERELGAIGEILGSEPETRQTLGAVNGVVVKSGLGRGLPTVAAVADAEACFRTAAGARGLQISRLESQAPEEKPQEPGKLKPGETWQVKPQDMIGQVRMEVVVNGPVPTIAGLIDDVSHCGRLVLVQSAKTVGSEVTLTAQAWYERPLPAPELELRWKSLDERLMDGGWQPTDPALAKDPAMARLKSAVDAGREQMPKTRSILKTTVELPRYIVRARELVQIREQILRVNGKRLLGLGG